MSLGEIGLGFLENHLAPRAINMVDVFDAIIPEYGKGHMPANINYSVLGVVVCVHLEAKQAFLKGDALTG